MTHNMENSDERYGRIACMMDVKKEEKEEGGRAPDYVQERTGHTRRSFSHSMTQNSNTSTQAKADRLPML